MRKKVYIFMFCLFISFCQGLTSCEEQDHKLFDSSRTGIYFMEDSVVYSFGVTALDITSREMKLPVRIMGAPAKEDRTFRVEVIPEKTTAKENVHYQFPVEIVIATDSVDGVLPLTVLRDSLGDEQPWQVAFRLLATEDFEPEGGMRTEMVASFNNIVSPPQWYDWTGELTWPDFKLGVWDPVKWVKFMEYFRSIEQKAPVTYKGMVEAYGPDLENVQYGWMWDHDYTVTKYILIPLYDFFEEHPELLKTGVNDVPKPY